MKNKGETVAFRLDGNWYGTGVIIAVREKLQNYVVKLDDPCKEFAAGELIEVDHSELVV